jgi:hypothetical protein
MLHTSHQDDTISDMTENMGGKLTEGLTNFALKDGNLH